MSNIIGVIGAGANGASIARSMARAGLPVILANSRGPETLAGLVRDLGPSVRAGTREEAASADMVVVAVNWSKLPAALAGLPDWTGRLVIDANNPIEAPLFRPFDLGGRTSSELFASMVPGAMVVKAFNHLPPDLMSADPGREGGRRVLFLSADDMGAKAKVSAVMDRMGFAPVDLGDLAVGARLAQFPGGPLPALYLVRFG